MSNKDKQQILLIDLCGRLPYGTYCKVSVPSGERTVKLDQYNTSYLFEIPNGVWRDCKPYLRPMSSMTEEEKKNVLYFVESHKFSNCLRSGAISDYLNSIHIDYRGLIPMGLALEAPKDMYKF